MKGFTRPSPDAIMDTMKKALLLILCLLLLLPAGCSSGSQYKKYSYEFLDTFDTVIQVMGYCKNQGEFDAWAKKAQARFVELNRLYDMYDDYDGVSNIKTINDNAGRQPVAVDPDIISMLLFCKQWQAKSPEAVNIALGSMLRIWHDYRQAGLDNPEQAAVPPMDELTKAATHSSIDDVVVDEAAGTVFLNDPEMLLDVGSVAKGYATELVAQELQSQGWQSFVINSGGNVRAVGGPLDGTRSKWGVGITDPDNPGSAVESGELLDTAFVAGLSVTTAGDYQRYYMVDGKRYHHIVDPSTLMPADRFQAVTVVAGSSAVADYVDTVLFILPYEEGLAYIQGLGGIEALWVLPDGSVKATEGMKAMLKNLGGATSK